MHRTTATTPQPPHRDFDFAVQADFGAWTINDIEIDEAVAADLNATFDDWGQERCPYCHVALAREQYTDLGTSNDEWHLDRTYVMGFCGRCAFWWFRGLEQANRCMDAPSAALAASIAKRFTSEIPEGCAHELAQYLRRHPAAWHTISPRSLEMLVADVFRANYAGCEVIHVGRPGDLGIDVVFVDHGKCTWLVQVKRRGTPGRPEGFSTLQSLLGTLALEGRHHGIIVTTADYFSHQLHRQRGRAQDRGFVIDLVDKGLLDRMLDPVLPSRPWLKIFEMPVFSQLDSEVRRYFLERIPDTRQGE